MRPLITILAMAATISTFGATLAEPAQAQQSPVATRPGVMLYYGSGGSVAAVYRVTPTGDAQVMVEGRLVTVRAATLSRNGDKLTTSLSRTELRQLGKAQQWQRR